MPTPRRYPDAAARQAAYRARQAEARRQEQVAKGMPALPVVATRPGHARWRALLRQAHLLLEMVQEEMQEYHDQRSERWQEAERGESFRDRLEALQAAQEAVAELLA
jgi:hypothetical protein